MPTRRTPLHRSKRSVITPASLRAFRRLYEAETHEEWKEAEAELSYLVTDGRPWPYPIVVPPDEPWNGVTNRDDYDEARRNWDRFEDALLECPIGNNKPRRHRRKRVAT